MMLGACVLCVVMVYVLEVCQLKGEIVRFERR